MPELIKITPDMTIEKLLTAFPELENDFNALVPTFGKLKAGVFRDTIARTTRLEQAASASRMRLPDLIQKLSKLAGLEENPGASNAPGKPLWVSAGTVVKELDARPLLAQGVHPKDLVITEVNALESNQIFVLLTPFVPGPLIEIARSQGFQTWTKQGAAGKVETYFGRD